MTDICTISDKDFVIQATKKNFYKDIPPEKNYLCINQPNVMDISSYEYFLAYVPETYGIPSQKLMRFCSVKEAENWLRRNLVEVIRDIGEVEEINFCSLKKVAYVTQENKFEIDSKYLSPNTYKIDNTSCVKTKPLPTKTLYKDY